MKALNILLVEDSPSDAELAKEAFLESKLKNNLIVIEDGDQALKYLENTLKGQSDIPDLILLDLNLPGKNGKEVLKEIKSHPQLKHIPVVILTTSKAEIDIVKSYQLQASSYITKPVDFEKFVSIVRDIQEFYFTVVTLAPNGPHNGKSK